MEHCLCFQLISKYSSWKAVGYYLLLNRRHLKFPVIASILCSGFYRHPWMQVTPVFYSSLLSMVVFLSKIALETAIISSSPMLLQPYWILLSNKRNKEYRMKCVVHKLLKVYEHWTLNSTVLSNIERKLTPSSMIPYRYLWNL